MNREIPLKFLKQYWHVIVLLLIVIFAFQVRALPARYGELQALDPFYLFRMSEYALNNNWQLPVHDVLRYYPHGVNTYEVNYMLPLYLPPILYVFLTLFGLNMSFFDFAILSPALFGALAVLAAYFVGSEIFRSRITGLFVAFFTATVPAFITRTSAGFYEKEPTGGMFMIASVFFFARAYRKNSLISGILGGLCLALLSISWGGVQYIYYLLSAFLLLLMVLNLALVVMEYLFGHRYFKQGLEEVSKFFDTPMIKAFVPVMLLGLFLQFLEPFTLSTQATSFQLSLITMGLLLIRYAAPRLGLVKKEQEKYIIPAIIVFGVLALLIGSLFFDPAYNMINKLMNITPQSTSVIGTTVAENTPGSWGDIQSMVGTVIAGRLTGLESISWMFSIYLFMFLGAAILAIESFTKKRLMYLLPLVWIVSTIWSVLGKVRLLFILGPAAAVAAGFFAGWLVHRVLEYESKSRGDKPLKPGSIPVKSVVSLAFIAEFVSGIVGFNALTAHAFANQLGPSINGYWYEAMDYLANDTPEGSPVLSWWDFGYWFQTRGERPSIADGGNLGGIYGETDYLIADWFTTNTNNWTGWQPWLDRHGVRYILMDYSLPGKYGAISKISSRGRSVSGFLELSQGQTYQQGNKTILEFTASPYAIWIPTQGGDFAGAPIFLISQNGQYYPSGHVNKMCTSEAGIVQLGNEADDVGGCVAMTDIGAFYLPEETVNTIFSRLMFMGGYGLPVEKVFDNAAIKIYKLE